jgi:peptidylprolyl isomerase
MKRGGSTLEALAGISRLLVIAGLALVLIPGLVLIDGCGTKQEADTQDQDVADVAPQEAAESQPEPAPPETKSLKTVVSQGDIVKVQYKGTRDDGSVFDQSRPERPLVFTAGVGQMIPGFDRAVVGMKLNEQKTVKIPAAEAYGPRDETMIRDVPKSNFPEGTILVADQPITLTDPNGRRLRGTIVAVGDENVSVDFNHPLAGQDLTFEITVVGIE